MIRPASLPLLLFCVLTVSATAADDWPMWRFDAGHTAAGTNEIPQDLQLNWTRSFGKRIQVWDDPLNHDLMPYDRIIEPVVKDGRMYVGFNDADKVVAMDVKNGQTLWTYYTDGPVRFPPVAWKDRVICVSDDGHLHCVNAADGKLIWKFRGGPSNRKVLGNKRVISAWPARGAAVVADDTVYFAASIWPFMGTFIYAVDPADGRVIWLNDETSAEYIKQPHSAPSFAGVAPQGIMSVSGDNLIVPGGRSVPAVFDRATGKQRYFDINAGGKGTGGSFVIARDDEFYVHTRDRAVRGHDLKTGVKTAFMVNEPVLSEELVFTSHSEGEKHTIRAYDALDVDKKTQKQLLWEVEADGRGDLILAGDTLYAAGENSITAIELSVDKRKPPAVKGSFPVKGEVLRLLAASERLIAVTLEGQIQVFGNGEAVSAEPSVPAELAITAADNEFARSLVSDIKTDSGYVLWFGAGSANRIAAFLQQSEYQLIVVDEDAERVASLRRTFDVMGLYGNRISVHVGTPASYRAPLYIANAVIVGDSIAAGLLSNDAELSAAFDSVRPYGSPLIVLQDGVPSDELVSKLREADLENAEVTVAGNRILSTRVGALTGSADWTHQYGDASNTVKSDDSRVKLPLGVLWFGGSSNMDVLPRHGHGPPEQVIGGRLFVEGMNSMSCRDVYTGRILWHRVFKDLGTYDIYFDETYHDSPLSTNYNQVHIPGANGRGTNYVATPDAIYLAIGSECLVLNPDNGETVRTIKLPKKGDQQPQWGYIGVHDDVLLAGNGFANYRLRHGLKFEELDGKLSRGRRGYGSKSFDVSASAGLIAFDRHSGEKIWELDASHGFIHNGIAAGDGHVYCLDRLPGLIEAQMKRRGKSAPESYRIVAIDVRTGKPKWEHTDNVFGSWLSYSEEHKLLLQAGASGSDRLYTEVGAGMCVHHAGDGTIKWRDDKRKYSGPCILHGSTILTNANSYKLSAGAFQLLTGEPELTTNPITGEKQTWQVCRAYGCNNIIASENMLTFRSGAAGYYDLTTRSGTGNLGGFKSGCTANLVVANGILNAPDYTRTCSCAYQNQTSLGLVHMPEMEMWTINHEARLSKPGQRIEKIGINFGAPGDRVDDAGTLWVEWPPVGGEHADLDIKIDGEVDWYRTSSLKFSGDGPTWIGASGVVNASRITIPMSVSDPHAKALFWGIAQDSDDAEQKADGSMSLSSSDLELVDDRGIQHVGLRFANVEIPQGTKIRSAAIQFTADKKSAVPTELFLQAIDSANPPTFTETAKDVSSRKLLPEKIAWNPERWAKEAEAGEAQRTTDLGELLQQLVNRPDWKSGNAVGFVVTGDGKRVALSSMYGKAGPKLFVDADLERESAAAESNAVLHTVRLHFADPGPTEPGERVFNVSLQGKPVLDDVEIVTAAGESQRTIVREFTDIPIVQDLTIDFTPQHGQPILSGVEILRVESAKD